MGTVWNPLAAEDPLIGLLAVLVLAVDAGLLGAFAYHGLRKLGFTLDYVEETVKPLLSARYRELSLLVASTATAGSLYMSNVLGWEPCLLCWYQRILIYPLVAVTAVGVLLEKEDVADYAIPLALIGLPIAVYHAVLQRYEQFQSAGCSVTSVSCETTYSFFFGYISVPVMAATALAAVLLLMWRFSEREYV
jgi:disulfide bond formation protein DsbB